MSSNRMIIPEEFELNSYGRSPINKNGRRLKTNNNRQIIFNPNGTPVLNNNNFQLSKKIPQDPIKNIKKHKVTNYPYRIIEIQNRNSATIEKYVIVNEDGQNIMDGENSIYLNKETGEPISSNGKKYKYNSNTKKFVKIGKYDFKLRNSLRILTDLMYNFDVVVDLHRFGKNMEDPHLDFLFFLNNQFQQNYTEWTLELDNEIDSLTSDELFQILDRFIMYIGVKKITKITDDSLLFKMICELVKKILKKIYDKKIISSDDWKYKSSYDPSKKLFDFLWNTPRNKKGQIINKDRYKEIYKEHGSKSGNRKSPVDIFAYNFLKKFTVYQ